MSEQNQGDVRAAIEAVERLNQPHLVGTSPGIAGELVALPKGLQVVDLKQYLDLRRERPERRTGTARLTALASFVAHVKRFADEHTAIFAVDDPRAPRLIAVLDYHEQTAAGAPRFGAHRTEYAFPLSDEWKAWSSIVGKELSQAAFAEWLEERIADVMNPEGLGVGTLELAQALGIQLAGPTALLALSRGLSVRVDQKVTQAVNLSTGEASIGFEETHRDKDGGGPLKVPGGFAIALPVFRNGETFSVVARLRYRVREGAVLWRIVLHRADAVFDVAFREACAKAETETGVPLFYGQPEA